MARPLNTDYLHSMRFHVSIDDNQNSPVIDLNPSGRPDAGFSNVTTPEATVEAVEYKEGTMVYTQKYPGNPTMSDITLSRGVARQDSSFWGWLRVVLEGGPLGSSEAQYRADLTIKHYHRDNSLVRDQPTTGANENRTSIKPADITAARSYHVKQAFPIRHKVAGDLDATASEISIMELDLAYEYFEVEEHDIPS